MAGKHKRASQRQEHPPWDDLAQLALIPVGVGAGLYILFGIVGAPTGTEGGQGFAVAGFLTVLTSLIVTAFKEAVYRREEKERWEQQRALLSQLSEWLRTNSYPAPPTSTGDGPRLG